jgi:hypothetical protein
LQQEDYRAHHRFQKAKEAVRVLNCSAWVAEAEDQLSRAWAGVEEAGRQTPAWEAAEVGEAAQQKTAEEELHEYLAVAEEGHCCVLEGAGEAEERKVLNEMVLVQLSEAAVEEVLGLWSVFRDSEEVVGLVHGLEAAAEQKTCVHPQMVAGP